MTTAIISTVPEVRAAVQTRIAAALSGADITDAVVSYGHPGQQIPYKFVAVETTEQGIDQEASAKTLPVTRRGANTETYALPVYFWVLAAGQHDSAAQRAATEACWAMVRAVVADQTVDADAVTLGGLVSSALYTHLDDDEFVTDAGRAAQIVANLSVTAARI